MLFDVEPPAAGPELSSIDVDPEWFTEHTGEDPLSWSRWGR